MTGEHDGEFGPPLDDLTDINVDACAATLRDLSRDERDPPFPPAAPTDRDDSYDAYVTPLTAENADDGPLSDRRIAVKGNVAVRGIPMTVGTDAITVRPDADAAAIERLRRAGATLTGTTAMDVLAFGTTGEFGPTAGPRIR